MPVCKLHGSKGYAAGWKALPSMPTTGWRQGLEKGVQVVVLLPLPLGPHLPRPYGRLTGSGVRFLSVYVCHT